MGEEAIMRLALLMAMTVAGLSVGSSGAAEARSEMTAFKSDAELRAFLAKREKAREASYRRLGGEQGIVPPPPPVYASPPPSAPPASSAAAPSSIADSIVVTGAKTAEPGITNTQEAGVDEGGIVKVHGRHLVVLRRGRLFTVALGDDGMTAIDRIDAFPPGATGAGAWYDEMLVSGDRVIVIGFSYRNGGTEINRFLIADDGHLSFEDAHHLRSNDYYSSSNYASRLIGDRLIVYTPLELDEDELIEGLPALRRWTGDPDAPFQRIAPPSRIYIPRPVRRDATADISTLHTVTNCDLSAARLTCAATGVLGSDSRNFYVSGQAVYVWIADAFTQSDRALVYRLPLDGSRPGAIQAWGGPVDQFSFREDRGRRSLDVLVRADTGGDRMWRPEVSDGDAALVRLPLARFGDGSAVARPADYRPLPLNKEPNWNLHNRFVGDHLIYAAGELDEEAGYKTLFAVPLDGGGIEQMRVPHGIDRIDIIGADAIAIGNDARGGLGFSAVALPAMTLADTTVLPDAREGERRSQAFFYRTDPDSADGASGMLGLPIARALEDLSPTRFLGSGSAVAFLRRDRRRLSPAGELVADAAGAQDDGCRASCVDWYGNARPIFLGDRVFALMGYELVEGRTRFGRITERRRLNFAPGVEPVR